jgi:hypothetical protein
MRFRTFSERTRKRRSVRHQKEEKVIKKEERGSWKR